MMYINKAFSPVSPVGLACANTSGGATGRQHPEGTQSNPTYHAYCLASASPLPRAKYVARATQGEVTRTGALLLLARSAMPRPRPAGSQKSATGGAQPLTTPVQRPTPLPPHHQPELAPAKELQPNWKNPASASFLLPPGQPPALWSPPARIPPIGHLIAGIFAT